ncbi:hypothetical protein EDD21DRAFT_367541 [Dissophora ornata]|nr:hypothetical protein BGZ58_001053 [Dissophora ornata]KAI8604020.1 hypothetical protein EDD21DRAFT_367541 [Dissophora ornata]
MAFSVVKITSALLAVGCIVQAVPVLERRCVGNQCYQSAHSGNVDIGSSTNITPVTQVTPITRYQPIVQAYSPVVQSDCEEGSSYMPSLYGGISPGYGSYRYYMHPSMGGMMMLGDNSGPGGMSGLGRLQKRHHLGSQAQEECVPTETETCEQSVPGSTTDLGSYVTARPNNVVLPSTVYQGHVQSHAADILAAPAEHTELSHSNVDLGSNTYIQPVTKVIPQTTYQPSVDQKATTIEAAAPEDQSLERSSVSLGSSVTVRPVTSVEPVTVFQPSIQSLPFLISDEGCD